MVVSPCGRHSRGGPRVACRQWPLIRSAQGLENLRCALLDFAVGISAENPMHCRADWMVEAISSDVLEQVGRNQGRIGFRVGDDPLGKDVRGLDPSRALEDVLGHPCEFGLADVTRQFRDSIEPIRDRSRLLVRPPEHDAPQRIDNQLDLFRRSSSKDPADR